MKKEKGKNILNTKYSILNTRSGKKPLRVGFDLDGVLLYNPARVARLPVSIVKRLVAPRKTLRFIVPHSALARSLWYAAHWTSLFIQPGFGQARRLMKQNKITGYLVSARYDFLKRDFDRRVKQLNANQVFSEIHMNTRNTQPHLFKERMIKKLELDIFIEDNLDIVQHLSRKTHAKIFWVYNILDRTVDYPYKFPNLKKAVKQIEKLL